MPGAECCELNSVSSCWVKFVKDSLGPLAGGENPTELVFGGLLRLSSTLSFFSRLELLLYVKEAVKTDCKEDEDKTGVAGDEQDCCKCGCRSVSGSSFSPCGKAMVSEDADCEEI